MPVNFMFTLAVLIGCLAYLYAAIKQLKACYATEKQTITQSGASVLLIGSIAALFHLLFTVIDTTSHHGISTSFFDALSVTSLIVVITALLTQIKQPIDALMVPIFLTAAICLALSALTIKHSPITASSPGMLVHILSSIVGYSLLSLAAAQAILLQLQENRLRNHSAGSKLQMLPPLQTMETLLFRLIGLGWLVLTVAIASGVLFIHDLLEQDLAHKTIFSFLSWLMFGLLLFGRKKWGWRASTAVKWTLTAFILLVLGYFGSKFVLDIVLHRL